METRALGEISAPASKRLYRRAYLSRVGFKAGWAGSRVQAFLYDYTTEAARWTALTGLVLWKLHMLRQIADQLTDLSPMFAADPAVARRHAP